MICCCLPPQNEKGRTRQHSASLCPSLPLPPSFSLSFCCSPRRKLRGVGTPPSPLPWAAGTAGTRRPDPPLITQLYVPFTGLPQQSFGPISSPSSPLGPHYPRPRRAAGRGPTEQGVRGGENSPQGGERLPCAPIRSRSTLWLCTGCRQAGLQSLSPVHPSSCNLPECGQKAMPVSSGGPGGSSWPREDGQQAPVCSG